MVNPISTSTLEFLDSLEATVREAASEVVARRAGPSGLVLSLEELLDLAKAIKLVAAADGLSRDELGALKFMMIMASVPNEVQQHVIDYDVGSIALDDVAEVFPPASRLAAYVLSGATTVAAFDGLTDDELSHCRELAVRLQLDTEASEALIAQGWALGLAMSRGDRAVVEPLLVARDAMLAWVGEVNESPEDSPS